MTLDDRKLVLIQLGSGVVFQKWSFANGVNMCLVEGTISISMCRRSV